MLTHTETPFSLRNPAISPVMSVPFVVREKEISFPLALAISRAS